MKSAELQTEETINKFEVDEKMLRDEIKNFIEEDPPIPGMDLKLPKQLKTHLLFDRHLLQWLKDWGTLGGLGEQNIETCHAIWNQLTRQFGACRGVHQKKLVMAEFLFNRAPFIWDGIDTMLDGTRRRISEKKTERKEHKMKKGRAPTWQDDELLRAPAADGLGVPLPLELDELELGINGEESLHPFLSTSND